MTVCGMRCRRRETQAQLPPSGRARQRAPQVPPPRRPRRARNGASRLGFPADTAGATGIALSDLDGDGRADLVASCESATGERIGIFALLPDGPRTAPRWRAIAGAAGIEFDRGHLLALYGDGALDVRTNDAQQGGRGLGVLRQETPARAPRR